MDTLTMKEKRNKTIQRILDAAANIFSQVDFAGARMDEIAKITGVNKATIYYHIGDKKALYAVVLHDVLSNTAERIVRNIKEEESPEDKLKTYIRNFVRTVDQCPHMPPIMMREFASSGKNFPEVAAQDLASIFGMLTDILEEGKKKGVFIKTNLFIIHLMIIGPLAIYKMSYPIRSKYAEFPLMLNNLDKNVSGSVAEEIEKLVLRAVKK